MQAAASKVSEDRRLTSKKAALHARPLPYYVLSSHSQLLHCIAPFKPLQLRMLLCNELGAKIATADANQDILMDVDTSKVHARKLMHDVPSVLSILAANRLTASHT